VEPDSKKSVIAEGKRAFFPPGNWVKNQIFLEKIEVGVTHVATPKGGKRCDLDSAVTI